MYIATFILDAINHCPALIDIYMFITYYYYISLYIIRIIYFIFV